MVPFVKMQRAAQDRIGRLVKWGLLEKPYHSPCFMCGTEAQHYHHFNGYRGENVYRVLPLCSSCHMRITIQPAKVCEASALKRRERFYERHKGHRVYFASYAQKEQMVCADCKNKKERQRYEAGQTEEAT